MAEETAQIYKRQKHKRVLAIAGIVLLLLGAVGAGAGVRWMQTKDDTTPPPMLPEVVSDLQTLRLADNMDAFDEEIRAALANPDLDDETRYMLLLQQGHAFVDRQEWQAAVEAYRAAEQIEATFEVAEVLADTYAIMGDVGNAVAYYERAIERNPSDNPVRDADNDAFKQKIRDLEEGQ